MHFSSNGAGWVKIPKTFLTGQMQVKTSISMYVNFDESWKVKDSLKDCAEGSSVKYLKTTGIYEIDHYILSAKMPVERL